jgi:hypothetical protein
MSDPHIVGLDVLWAWPCRCGCPKTRVAPYSKVSKNLIWKCPWCGKRRGKPTEDVISKLTAFVAECGWNMRPLVIDDEGHCYVR